MTNTNECSHEDICLSCEIKVNTIEDFIEEFIELTDDAGIQIDVFIDMLEDFYEAARTEGKRSALEQISNIALDIAYADVED